MGNKASSLAKSQDIDAGLKRRRAYLQRRQWPDASPRSTGNVFTSYLDGRPSIFTSAQDKALATRSASSTAAVERSRAKGIEPAMVYGLSTKGDEAKRTRRKPAAVKVARA